VTRSALAVLPVLALVASATSLRAQQQLYAKDGEVDADRAAYVAALGDVNNDGKPDFVVGAPSAVVASVATGAVYVRSGVDGSLIYSITGDIKGFGSAVAKIGDVDGDGVNDFVVGSPFAVNSLGKARGAVWGFSGKTGTPQDIVDYKLPTHPLKDVDIKRARDAIKNDPFFQHHKEWVAAVEHLLKMGVRAEQQALAKWGLNYVIDTYLPEKLKHPEKFLP
jgi:hypothetical protein